MNFWGGGGKPIGGRSLEARNASAIKFEGNAEGGMAADSVCGRN